MYSTNTAYADIGVHYESLLAERSKEEKKENGQYYTPKDVARVMSEWFDALEGENICDVGCGTGNLILTFLEFIGKEKAKEIIAKGCLFLYDIDKTAIDLCKELFTKQFGKLLVENIHFVHCDFLDRKIHLPDRCKVISNPPYSQIKNLKSSWELTPVLKESNEYYSAFMEKIVKESCSSVIISPYSFLSGSKFQALREVLNCHNGFFVSFDNVPGNIFCGRKHGIFNTNTSNSVRATISVIKSQSREKGFILTPLIRFKNEEREGLLQCKVLENELGKHAQILDNKSELGRMYYKCHKELENVFELWKAKSTQTFKDLLDIGFFSNEKYTLYFPNTCRYVTTCATYNLKRSGKYQFDFCDEEVFYFCYCFLNSSFCYWFWRMYDGGITYQKGLLGSMPMFYDLLTESDKCFFRDMAKDMIEHEKNYIVTKNNVGIQENIKFPIEYRERINQQLLQILGADSEVKFDAVHRNSFFGE